MGGIVQVVNDDGDFDDSGVEEFLRSGNIDAAGVNYTVVAIMGPQSSGKSTLLNHLFGTQFTEMDALAGRTQTTRGVWLARSPKIYAPPTIVMDLEGSDGRERGEDDTSFERQSALFALATADVLLVNMWAKDVGREAGAGKPLLKTIFQVNLKLFQPSPGARRTVLLFAFRDRTKTPLDRLKETWETDLQRMWDGITKPPAYEHSNIVDFFEIQYAALSNYEEKPEDFLADVTILRRRFTDQVDDAESFLRPSAEKLPGHALALSMRKVWEVVKENKDLNLPAHRVMVANIRCAEIAAERAAAFEQSAEWGALVADAQNDLVPGFGKKAGGLLDSTMAAYEAEARYFDQVVSARRAESLASELHAMVRPAFDTQLSLARAVAMESFRIALADANITPHPHPPAESFVDVAARCTAGALSEFDAAARHVIIPSLEWTAAAARESLQRELAAHRDAVRSEHVSAALSAACRLAESAVSSGAMPLMEAPPADLWVRLSSVVERAATAGIASLAGALQGYGLDAAEDAELRSSVRAAARGRLLATAREAANTALPRLKERFTEVFQKDEAGMPRNWVPSVDIHAVAMDARRAAAVLLSQLCVVQLQSSSSKDSGHCDVVEPTILRLAESSSVSAALTSKKRGEGGPPKEEFDLLSATEWPCVAAENVLLSPSQVRSLWRQFSSDVALSVQQAVATQEANKLAQNRLPPIWAIAAMVILGFNEAVAVLRNPLLLVGLLLLFMFARTVYQELDVEGEMARGLLPGLMSLSAKFVPTVKTVTLRTFEATKTLIEGPSEAAEEGVRRTGIARADVARVRFDEIQNDAGLRARKPREVEMQEGFRSENNRKDD